MSSEVKPPHQSKHLAAAGPMPRRPVEVNLAAAGGSRRSEITDALGRALLLRELDALEEQDLIGLVGEPLCLNRLYMTRAFEACRIAAIDAEPVNFPLSQAQLRALFNRLGRDGLEAIMRHTREARGAALRPPTSVAGA